MTSSLIARTPLSLSVKQRVGDCRWMPFWLLILPDIVPRGDLAALGEHAVKLTIPMLGGMSAVRAQAVMKPAS